MGGKKNTRPLKRFLGHVKLAKTWQLLLIFLLFIFLSATALRIDHVRMASLRSEVLEADQEGNSELLAKKLSELQKFTLNHIVVNVVDDNGDKKVEFGTGVFYLEQSYIKDATTAMEKAAGTEVDDSNPNGNIYAAASAICRPKAIANGWAWNSPGYLNCFTEELAKYPADTIENATATAAVPSTELYRREFVSPVWTPCLAGFLILITVVLGVVIFIRFLIWLILEITLIIIKKA
ncbi:hypothetical protein IKF81_01440 [Candidatus Saccharibacteria bacterium]|nr:hypothetical protein [Candidatus Saccharibacteria bacterium]